MHNKKKTAIVVEGGGFKSIFTAGVLDAFLSFEYDPFDIYLGVSGGAMNLSSYVSKQYKRNYKIINKVASNSNLFSIVRYLKGGNYFGLDILLEDAKREMPFDFVAANRSVENRDFLIVVTNIETGKPIYLNPKNGNWIDYLKASGSLPVVTRGFFEMNSIKLIDGGISDPIPVKKAYELGANRIILLRTFPVDYVADWGLENLISPYFYSGYDRLQRLLNKNAEIYNNIVRYINKPQKDLEIIQIAPDNLLDTTTMSQDKKTLNQDYCLGLEKGLDFLMNTKIKK